MHPAVGGGCVVVFGVERFPVGVSGGEELGCLVVLRMTLFGVGVDGKVVAGAVLVGVGLLSIEQSKLSQASM